MSNWYMSLAHLKKGNKEAAEALLKLVVENDGWKKAEASALLNSL